jgi:hypothetical protein
MNGYRVHHPGRAVPPPRLPILLAVAFVALTTWLAAT